MERDTSANLNTRVPCYHSHHTLVSALLVAMVVCILVAVVGFADMIPLP